MYKLFHCSNIIVKKWEQWGINMSNTYRIEHYVGGKMYEMFKILWVEKKAEFKLHCSDLDYVNLKAIDERK